MQRQWGGQCGTTNGKGNTSVVMAIAMGMWNVVMERGFAKELCMVMAMW